MHHQDGLKSFRSFRWGCAFFKNIDLMGGLEDGGCGGGGGSRNFDLISGAVGGGDCSRNLDLIGGVFGRAGGDFDRRRDMAATDAAILDSAKVMVRPATSPRNRETR